jgi:anti-sigma B factor antagonist
LALTISASTPYPGTRVLTVAGELDLGSAEAMREALIDAVKSTDVDAVLVDLEGLTFLDSTGIGVLVAGWRSAGDSGKRLRVDSAHGMALEVMKITGVWPHLGGGADTAR